MSMLKGRQQFLIMLDIGASQSTVSVYIRIYKESDTDLFHGQRQADIVLIAGLQPTLSRNQPLFRINANHDFAASKALQRSLNKFRILNSHRANNDTVNANRQVIFNLLQTADAAPNLDS